MNIAFFTHYTSLYGANKSMLALISGLKKEGHNIFVFVPEEGKLNHYLDEAGIKHYKIPFPMLFTSGSFNMQLVLKRLDSSIKTLPILSNICIKEKIDLVYSNSSVIDTGLLVSRLIKKPHVWHFREFGDIDYELRPDFGKALFNELIKLTDGHIFVSNSLRNYYPGSISNSIVIYNGIVSKDVLNKSRMQWLNNKLFPVRKFVIVGLVRPSKGQLQAVQAFSEVVKKYPQVVLSIIGGGMLDWLKEILSENSIEKNIRITGEIPNPFDYYLNSDAALMCSPNEAMGRVTVEGMAAGIPVIGYNSAATPELIIHGYNGLLYNGSAEDLYRKMIYLIENPLEAKRMGLNGINNVSENYTTEKYVSRVSGYINYVVASCNSNSSMKRIYTTNLNSFENEIAEIYNQILSGIIPAQSKSIYTYQNNLKDSEKSFLTFSVITPSFNQGKYIEQSIQSVLNQNYPYFEHIITDGGSTDETIDILNKYSHLRWVSEKDNGQADAVNKGFDKAAGDIIAWINSDDWYEPEAFKAVNKFFTENPDKNIVMGNCNLVDNEDRIFDVVKNFERGFNELKKYWIGKSIPTQPAVFFRKKLVEENGVLDPKFYYAMDYDLWMRFALKERFYYVNQIFANYRFHSDAKGGDQDWYKFIKEWEEVFNRYVQKGNSPLISVIVPCYNYGRYLTEAVESIISQTFKDFEIIIVNDGSTDNSKEIAEDLIRKYDDDYRIKLINQANSGQPAYSRNNGIKEAKGDYILCLDADDKIAPSMLEECIKLLEKNQSLAIAYTHRQDFDGSDQLVKAQEYDFEVLKWQNIISVCSLFRKKAWEDVGGYRTNVKGLEDWDFWIALGSKGYFGKLIPKPLFYYRRHDTGVFQEAAANYKKKFAQIILNNKSVYTSADIIAAEDFLRVNKEEQIKISVIIPTHNRPLDLKVAVQSVINQSYENWEAVVVNDAGEDVSQIVKGFNDNRIKYLSHEKNKGLAAARNTGIKNASGKYIAYLDDDDIYYPNHLETLVKVLEQNNYQVAYTDSFKVTQELQNGNYVTINKNIPFSNDFLRENLACLNLAPVQCFMHEKSCIDNSCLFDETLKAHEDWDFWIRLSHKYDFHHIKKITSEFRQRTDKTNMTTSQHKDFYDSYREIIIKYYNNNKSNLEILKKQITNLNILKQKVINAGQFRNEKVNVSIIIPVFNKAELTQKCLAALYKYTPRETGFEVIIVNNASTDETSDYLTFAKNVFENLSVINNSINTGFAKANNSGVQKAKGEYVLFLNNDTEPLQGWLEKLLNITKNDKKAAAAGSKLLFPDGTIQHAGVIIIEDKQLPDPLVARHIYWKSPSNLKEANQLKTYQALTAACFLVKKNIFNQVGGFDEQYWNGYEDVDLCFKLGEAGYKLVYQPASVVIHHESQSGRERFSQVSHNINLLHKKWLGKIKPDFILEKDGNAFITDANIIQEYTIPQEKPAKGPSEKPITSIIALTYNQLEYTKQFVESVLQKTQVPYELIIVDNGSSDGTVDYLNKLQKSGKRIKIFFNKKNLGFPKGINQGLKAAEGKYFLIANNDIIVTEGWLERMIEVAESDEKIGLVGPVSNSVSGVQLDDTADYKTIEEMHSYAASVKKKYKNQAVEFPRVAFLCTLIKKEVIEKTGGLDERFSPGNFEDDDFCLRAQIAGYKTIIAKDIFIHHFGSKSFTAEGFQNYKAILETNREIFINKWGGTPEDIWLKGKQIKGRKIMFTLNKNEFTENLQRALSLIEEKDYDIALDYLKNSVDMYNNFDHDENDPDLVNLLNLAGNISLLNGNTETAQKYFEYALNEDNNSSYACSGLADIFYNNKNYKAAKTMYEWGIKHNPVNNSAVEGLIRVNRVLNLPEDDNSLLIDGKNEPGLVTETTSTDNFINEAYKLFHEKRYEMALDNLKKAENMFNGQLKNPVDIDFAASFYNFKGFNYMALNDIENAKECFQKAMEINPESSQAYAGLGEILYLNEYDEQAKIMFEKAIEKNPGNIFAAGGLEKVNNILNKKDVISEDQTNNPDKLKIYHRDDFGKLFNELKYKGRGLEVGVQAGTFSQTLRNTWKGEELFLVDRWKYSSDYKDISNVSDEKQKELYLSVVEKFSDDHSVKIIRQDSLNAAKQFPDEFFDWIYLDADHSYEGCINDLKAWYPKLKKGGILAGHDYVDGEFIGGIFGVKSAVDRFILDKEVILYTTEEEPLKSWYFIKPGDDTISLEKENTVDIIYEEESEKIKSVLNEILEASYELFNLERYSDAIETLTNSEDIFYSVGDKELTTVFENLKGFSHLGLNEKGNARESFETALNINPESSQACAGLAELFYLENKLEEAKTMFEYAVKNNPGNEIAEGGLEKVNKLLDMPVEHNSLYE